MSADPDAIQTAVPTAEQLRRVAPFSRHVHRRGRQLFKPLRRELLQKPAEEIAHLDLKIAKCLEMCAAFTDPGFLDRVADRLAQRFGNSRVHAPLLRALVFQRRFEDACGRAIAHADTVPDDPGVRFDAIRYQLIAGKAEAALGQALVLLSKLIDDAGPLGTSVAGLLLQAGRAAEVQDIRPDIAALHPGFARERTLSAPDGQLPIFCMTLDRDQRRMATTRHFLSGAGQLREVTGVDGSALPSHVLETAVTGEGARLSRGEVGCSLSHLSTWERVAEECGDDDYALVLEDDSHFLFGPGKGLGEVLERARAAKAGLVFVNERACRTAATQVGQDPVTLFPVAHDFAPGTPRAMPRDPGWGGDGYLLSGGEASRLCDIWSKTGLLGALDWQLHLMCFAHLEPWQDHKFCRSIYRSLAAMERWPRIDGYVSNLALTGHSDFGFSSINSLA